MRHRLLGRIGPAKPRWLLLPALALALALPSPATAYLYWVNNGNIARSNLDGTAAQEDYIPISYPHGGVGDIALSDSFIYLAIGGSGGKIGRVNLGGGNFVPVLFTIPQPVAEGESELESDASLITASGNHIYWSGSNFAVREGKPQIIGRTAIGRAGIDGSHIEPQFVNSIDSVEWVATDANHLYWVARDRRAIARANLDGHEIEPHFIVSHSDIHGLAVGEGHVYWGTEHGVGRANLNGRGVDEHFITGLPYVLEIAVGGGYIFWHAWEYPLGQPPPHVVAKPGWVGRANIDGSAIRQRIVTFPGFDSGSIAANSLGPDAQPPTHHPQHHPQRPRRHRRPARHPKPHRKHRRH